MSFQSMGHTGKNWWTPRWFVRALEAELGVSFVCDMAACEKSKVCERFVGESDNALVSDWGTLSSDGHLFCNPPWSNVGPFLGRCVETGGRAIFVLPNRMEARWGRLVEGYPIYIVSPRLNYWDPEARRIRTGNGIGTVVVNVSPETQGKNTWSFFDTAPYKPANT